MGNTALFILALAGVLVVGGVAWGWAVWRDHNMSDDFEDLK